MNCDVHKTSYMAGRLQSDAPVSTDTVADSAERSALRAFPSPADKGSRSAAAFAPPRLSIHDPRQIMNCDQMDIAPTTDPKEGVAPQLKNNTGAKRNGRPAVARPTKRPKLSHGEKSSKNKKGKRAPKQDTVIQDIAVPVSP